MSETLKKIDKKLIKLTIGVLSTRVTELEASIRIMEEDDDLDTTELSKTDLDLLIAHADSVRMAAERVIDAAQIVQRAREGAK